MTRTKISIFILAALIAFSASSAIFLKRRCNELIGILEDAKSYAETDELDEILEQSEQFSAEFDKFTDLAHFIIRNDKLTDIATKSERIAPLALNACDELTADISELIDMISQLRDSELPSFSRIF